MLPSPLEFEPDKYIPKGRKKHLELKKNVQIQQN